MSETPEPPFIRYFKIGFAAACGAIAAIALALAIVFAVNGVMDAASARRQAEETQQLRQDLLRALEELRAQETP